MTRFLPLLLGLSFAACQPASTPAPEVSPGQDSVRLSKTDPSPAAAGIDTAAVDLRLATSQQILAHVSDGAAPMTLVNFWATWCGPCIIEFPDLINAQQALQGEGFRLVFVSMDETTSRADVLRFLARRGVSGPTFLNSEPDHQAFAKTFSRPWSRAGTLPASFLYNRNGEQVAYFDRPVTFAALTDTVRALMRTSSL